MKPEKLLPMKDLEIFGVYKKGQFTIPEKEVDALRNGRMTDIIELADLKGKDLYIEKLPARLSIVRGEDGNPSLRIDPVYREPNTHPKLDENERQRLIRQELANIKKSYLDKDGNIQTEIIEYDPKTKQFLSYDPRAIKAPERVNQEELSPQQKKKYKEGETVELADGTEFQLSTSAPEGIRSNRTGLIVSVLLDGGLSYLLFTGISKLLGKKSSEQKAYNKGYLDAIKQAQTQFEARIAKNSNDKDAVKGLNRVNQEIFKILVDPSLPQTIKQNFELDKAKKLNSIDLAESKNPLSNQSEEQNGTGRRL